MTKQEKLKKIFPWATQKQVEEIAILLEGFTIGSLMDFMRARENTFSRDNYASRTIVFKEGKYEN